MPTYNERYLEILIRKDAVAEVKDFVMQQKLWAETQLQKRKQVPNSDLELFHYSIYNMELTRCLRVLEKLENELNEIFERYENP